MARAECQSCLQTPLLSFYILFYPNHQGVDVKSREEWMHSYVRKPSASAHCRGLFNFPRNGKWILVHVHQKHRKSCNYTRAWRSWSEDVPVLCQSPYFPPGRTKKITVQYKVTTSVEEPQMMTVAPLYRDCLNLAGGSLNNSLYTANECPTYI